FVAFKRWIKIVGHPIMVLIILTEPDPEQALKRLMKRCGYVLLSISILFIKYFPELGRGFDSWTGAPVETGITTNKNEMGYVCLVLGYFAFWNLLQARHVEERKTRRAELLLNAWLLGMAVWLLARVHSGTSLVSLLAGALTVLIVGLRAVNKRFL